MAKSSLEARHPASESQVKRERERERERRPPSRSSGIPLRSGYGLGDPSENGGKNRSGERPEDRLKTHLEQAGRTRQLQRLPEFQDGRGVGRPAVRRRRQLVLCKQNNTEKGHPPLRQGSRQGEWRGVMLHEVELLEELPYYRSLARPRPPHHQQDETPIAIIAPDIRTPSKQQHHHQYAPSVPQQYSGPGCPEVLVSVAAYGTDVATDLALCCALFVEGRLLWSALVVAFVLLSAFVVNACSVYWYLRSQKSSTAAYTSVGRFQWGIRAVAHVLLLGLLYRYLHLLCSRCLCRGQQQHHHQPHEDNNRGSSVVEARKRKNALRQVAVREDRQAAVLGLLHSLLESTPQLILQLYTMAQRTDADSLVIVFMQGTCALSSLFQTTWSITSYNSTLHRTTAGKRTLSGAGKALQFLWHFCTVGSRACTLALFAREYHLWLFPFCIGHWGVMTVWVMHQQTKLCRRASDGQLRQCREYAGNMVVGVAYVIYYLNVKAEPTRYKYSAYYAVVFAENCILMTLWFLRNDPGAWYHIPALVAVFSSFTSGVVFMLFYYGFCHRTLRHKNDKQTARCC